MDYDAEFFVLLGFLVFVGILIYFGVPRMVLKALDARGEAIAAELCSSRQAPPGGDVAIGKLREKVC